MGRRKKMSQMQHLTQMMFAVRNVARLTPTKRWTVGLAVTPVKLGGITGVQGFLLLTEDDEWSCEHCQS